MKYKIDWIEKKTGKSGTNYWEMSMTDEEGKNYPKVSTFEGSYTAGMEMEGDIVQSGNFLNWRAKLEKPAYMQKGSGFAEKKKADIIEMQTNKAKSIAEAQDRSAWMWAKNNATELLKGEDMDLGSKLETLERVATKIYNMEPLEPFN